MLVDQNEKVRTDLWHISPHVLKLETSIIREILKVSSQPGVISFAGGLPAPELFPIDDMAKISQLVLKKHGARSLQYSFSRGINELRELIAQRASERGTPSTIDNILITSGGQQAIELMARVFVSPGDYIMTESPTYVGALQAFNYYQPKYAAIEMDDEGIIIDQVEEKIKKFRPRFIYTVSNFQNPTGITMSTKRRERLVELATRYHIPIVDDNPYGDIRFSGKDVPTLKSIGGDIVIAVRTFSKIITPGLRIGWINGPAEIMHHFEKVKQGTDLHSTTFCQYLIHEYISAGLLEPHIEKIKVDYREKRDTMLKAMKENFPEGVKWTEPDGGLFLWVELPKHMSTRDLLPKAIEKKVAYVYGQPFFPDGSGENTMRLNYSNATRENIVKGIKTLGELFRENM